MSIENPEDLFKKVGDNELYAGLENFTIEELYQAFQARMKRELEEEIVQLVDERSRSEQVD